MKEKTYGLAVVGFGGMGRRHTEMMQGVERLTLVGAYDILDRQRMLAESLGIRAYASLDEVLSAPEVDIVLIATPNHVHKEIAIRALQAGKNVICEKPVTMESRDLVQIIDAARQAGRLFMVHQNRRWDEDFLAVKEICDTGTIGDVFHLETRVHGSRGIPGDWRREKAHGGGMLLDWGVHLIDRLLYLWPEPVKKVYCKRSFLLGQEVDDGFRIFLTFDSGRTALIEACTWNFDSLPKWYVCGTKGTATILDWDMNGRIALLKDAGSHDCAPVKSAAGYTKTMAPRTDGSIIYRPLPPITADVRDFYRNAVGVLDGVCQQVIKNEEALRVIRLIEAAVESDTSGQTIDFE